LFLIVSTKISIIF